MKQETEHVTPDEEELLMHCLDIMNQEKKASTSLFQRRLRLGFMRASRILEIMENRGYVGPVVGSEPRKILKLSAPTPTPDLFPDTASTAPPLEQARRELERTTLAFKKAEQILEDQGPEARE